MGHQLNRSWQDLLKRHGAIFYYLPLGMMGASTTKHGCIPTPTWVKRHSKAIPMQAQRFASFACPGSPPCWSATLLGWSTCQPHAWPRKGGRVWCQHHQMINYTILSNNLDAALSPMWSIFWILGVALLFKTWLGSSYVVFRASRESVWWRSTKTIVAVPG